MITNKTQSALRISDVQMKLLKSQNSFEGRFLTFKFFIFPPPVELRNARLDVCVPGMEKRSLVAPTFWQGRTPPPGVQMWRKGHWNFIMLEFVSQIKLQPATYLHLHGNIFLLLELFERGRDVELKTRETSHCSAP